MSHGTQTVNETDQRLVSSLHLPSLVPCAGYEANTFPNPSTRSPSNTHRHLSVKCDIDTLYTHWNFSVMTCTWIYIMPSVDRKFPNIASRSFFSPHAYCWLLVPYSGKLQTFVIWGFSWRKLPRITLWCLHQKMPLPPTLQRKISQIATKPREFSPSKVSHYTGCLSSSQPQNHAGLLPRLVPVIHYFPPCSSMPSSLVCAFTDVGSSLWGQQESCESFWRGWFGIEMLKDDCKSMLVQEVCSRVWYYQGWIPHAAETTSLGIYCSWAEEAVLAK